MWEYRIFTDDDLFAELPLHLVVFGTSQEERIDYYYHFGIDGFGIKSRLESQENNIIPKLELKIRTDHSDGIDYWEKVMSTNVYHSSGDTLSFREITEIVSSQLDSTSQFSAEMDYFIDEITENYEIIEVKKSRWKSKFLFYGKIIKIEYVSGIIDGMPFNGVSIESEYKDAIIDLIHEWGLNKYDPVAGYPGLIKSLQTNPQIL